MPIITVVFGLLLSCLTVFVWIYNGRIESFSVFIPTFVGVPLILLGLFSLMKPALRKHLMHAAVTLGLLGALAALGRGIPQILKVLRQEAVDWLPVSMVWAMVILCVTYVFLCSESFISARKARQAAEAKGATSDTKPAGS